MDTNTAIELSATDGLRIELTPGLHGGELERRILLAWRAGEVCNRALAFYLADMEQRRVYVELGHPTTVKFAVKRLGISKRRARELLAAGRRLGVLRRLDQALSAGELTWSKARLVARVATPETEQVWIDRTRPLTHEEVHALVRTARRGHEPGNVDAMTQVVRVKRIALSAAQARIWERVRRDLADERSGAVVPDGEVLDALLRCYRKARSPRTSGRAPRTRDSARAPDAGGVPLPAAGARVRTRRTVRAADRPRAAGSPASERSVPGAAEAATRSTRRAASPRTVAPPFLDPAWWRKRAGHCEWAADGNRFWIEWKPDPPS